MVPMVSAAPHAHGRLVSGKGNKETFLALSAGGSCVGWIIEEDVTMRAAAILATAGALALGAICFPSTAEARGRFGSGPGLAGGLIAGAVIGGLASSAYASDPGYGYYAGPAYRYYGGYGPSYGSRCPQPGYGAYYNCGAYAVPGYGAPVYHGYGYGPW